MKSRRRNVISRLEFQLKSGSKNFGKHGKTELSDRNRNRINKEINILKTRI